MSAALVCFGSLVLFVLGYRYYARYLSQHLFRLQDEKGATVAHELRDNVDFVPTPKGVLLGHHFSSIAGAAPIVGPAIAIIWGWVPALIWIVIGVIFMGAAHDFGALVLSMKHKGQSMAEVARDLMGPRSRALFLTIIFFLVWMVIAVFALVIANLFKSFPASVIPVNFEIIIALIIGYGVNRRGGKLLIPSIVALISLFIMIYVGVLFPFSLESYVGTENEMMTWIIFLLTYSFIACILPVWALLQPRDYINSHQLFVGLFLMIAGLAVLNPPIVAPAFHFEATGAPPWFPFLFITIACGAISGFHGLVSSGTTSKQVAKWSDAKAIGYGSMLAEGLLALLATLAVATGFKSRAAWHAHYRSFDAADGLNAKIGAFVTGSGEFISALGIPVEISQTVIAVMIISFAATSLDTACRIQRYIIAEVGEATGIRILNHRYIGAFLAVATAFLLMLSQSGGRGGLMIWPLFGATNQMLAGLILLVISLWLYRQSRSFLPFLIPAILVILITTTGLYFNIKTFMKAQNTMLMLLAMILLIVQVWVVAEGYLEFRKPKKSVNL
jgi:carbon starvation protein